MGGSGMDLEGANLNVGSEVGREDGCALGSGVGCGGNEGVGASVRVKGVGVGVIDGGLVENSVGSTLG
jgi:hypothetical protein